MHSLRLYGLCLLLAPLLYQPVTAQALDPSFTPPTSLYASGLVYSMSTQQTDGKRVVAGFFSRFNGVAVGSLVQLDAGGAPDQIFAQNVGNASNVTAVVSLPNGQYLLGTYNGGAVTAGGVSRAGLLRLNASGTADAAFDPGTGPRQGSAVGLQEGLAVQADGKVLVVGEFDTFNGQAAAGVVRLNSDGSVDTSFSVGTGGSSTSNTYLDAVTVQLDGKILVSGSFTTFNGLPANGLVRLNANGSPDASFTSPFTAFSEPTSVVLQPDGRVLVAGGNLVIGTTRTGVVRLNSNGTVDVGFANTTIPGASTFNRYDASLLVQPDGKILVVGSFTLPNNTRIARLNTDGTLDASFRVSPGSNTMPYSVGLQADGSVLVGGTFLTAAGVEIPLGHLSSTGVLDNAFVPKLQGPGYVNAIVRQPDGQLVLGGNFTELNGQPVQRLVRLSSTGVVDASFAAASGTQAAVVNCLAIQADGSILVGANGVRRLTTTGSPDASFNYFAAGGTVTAMAVQPNGRLMVCGGNTSTSGYRFLFRVTETGAYDASFTRDVTNATGLGVPNTANAVLVQPDGRIVVAEDFVMPGTVGLFTSRVVRYTSTGNLDATFNNASEFGGTSAATPDLHRLYTLTLQPDGNILVGGQFGSVNGAARASVARLTSSGILDDGFQPSLPATTLAYSLALQANGRVVVGGIFTTPTTSHLTRLLPSGQIDNSFTSSANPNGAVRSVLVQPDASIVFGGSFTTVGSQPASGVARITAPGVLAVAAPTASVTRMEVWPVPAHTVLHVAPDASAHPLTLDLLDALGRLVRTLPVTPAATLTLDVAGLPTGVYLLRVQYATGTVTRQVAVQ